MFNGQITGGNLTFSNTRSGGGGGQSSEIFSNSGSESVAGNSPAASAESASDSLIKLIESTVRPDVWHDNKS